MNKQITVQAVAISLAAFVTFALLGSVGSVADQQYSQAAASQGAPVLASATTTAPKLSLVVLGKRLVRG